MGYYTYHSLEITRDDGGEVDEAILAHLIKEVNDGFDPFEDNHKWYDEEKEMRAFSLKYPNYLFHVHGEGEESGDVWDATYQNGKMHRRTAVIHIDPFDPARLE